MAYYDKQIGQYKYIKSFITQLLRTFRNGLILGSQRNSNEVLKTLHRTSLE